MKFTDAGIGLKPGTKTYAVYDDELRGFGARVSARGAKTFTFLYRLNGRKTRLNLGRFPSVSLAAARTEAHKAIGAVKGERKDPRVAREEAAVQKTGGLTVTGLTDFYLASDKFKSGREATREPDEVLSCFESSFRSRRSSSPA